jgi:integrase
MAKRALTDAGIQRLHKPAKGQKDNFDKQMPGLAVRVSTSGTKTFVYFYRFGGKLRRDTLGRYTPKAIDTDEIEWGRGCALTLKSARRISAHISDLVEAGTDPHLVRDGALEATVKIAELTFAKAVDEFIEKIAIAKKQNRTWKAQKRTLLRVDPDWNDLPVASITRQQVHAALDACMASGKKVESNRRFAALSTFFKWLHSRDHIPENPMLGVQRPFDGERPSDRIWSDAELAVLWRCGDELDRHTRAYLRLLLLLGHRPGEVGGMRWDEISNFDVDGAAIWTLPPHRHKGGHKSGRKAVTPLPQAACRILKSLPHVNNNPFVFPGRGTHGGELRPTTVGTKIQRRIQKASGIADFDFKTARPTVRTGLDELEIPPHVKDRCLNHAPSGVGEKHYSKYTYEREQREAFEAWAKHVEKLVYPEGVVGLHG